MWYWSRLLATAYFDRPAVLAAYFQNITGPEIKKNISERLIFIKVSYEIAKINDPQITKTQEAHVSQQKNTQELRKFVSSDPIIYHSALSLQMDRYLRCCG